MRKREKKYLQVLSNLRTFIERDKNRGDSSISFYDVTDNLYIHFDKYPHFYSLGFYCRGYYKGLVGRIVRNHDKILETIEKIERRYRVSFSDLKKKLELLRTLYYKNKKREYRTIIEFLNILKVI